MIEFLKKPWTEMVAVFAIGFITCFVLYAYGIVLNHGFVYSFLLVNLALASFPLLISWRLLVVLRYKRWSAWEPLILTLLWLIFIPNSFYMISDYIHLQDAGSSYILYNSVLFTAFIYLALFMGIVSLHQVHQELRRRIRPRNAALMVAIVLLGCCYAIYLGRDLRWDSWDLIVNPGGVLFDISNLILKPATYPDMGRTILSFFALLGSAYLIAWRAAHLQWHKGVTDLAAHIKRSKSN